MARSGGSSKAYEAGPAELRFHDSGNARRRAVQLAGGESVTAYLSPNFRLRFGALSDSPSLGATLATLDWPIEVAAFPDSWNGNRGDAEESESNFGELNAALQRYGQTGHPGELARMRSLARRRGIGLQIRTELEDGIPYLLATKGQNRFLAPLSNFQGGPWAESLDHLREDGTPFSWRAP